MQLGTGQPSNQVKEQGLGEALLSSYETDPKSDSVLLPGYAEAI